jgi:hypothetical protein
MVRILVQLIAHFCTDIDHRHVMSYDFYLFMSLLIIFIFLTFFYPGSPTLDETQDIRHDIMSGARYNKI